MLTTMYFVEEEVAAARVVVAVLQMLEQKVVRGIPLAAEAAGAVVAVSADMTLKKPMIVETVTNMITGARAGTGVGTVQIIMLKI